MVDSLYDCTRAGTGCRAGAGPQWLAVPCFWGAFWLWVTVVPLILMEVMDLYLIRISQSSMGQGVNI